MNFYFDNFRALYLLERMREEGVVPDQVVLETIARACN